VGPTDEQSVHEPPTLALADGSNAIDAGIVLPGIDGRAPGGPDLGAVERGCAAPFYGPRDAADAARVGAIDCTIDEGTGSGGGDPGTGGASAGSGGGSSAPSGSGSGSGGGASAPTGANGSTGASAPLAVGSGAGGGDGASDGDGGDGCGCTIAGAPTRGPWVILAAAAAAIAIGRRRALRRRVDRGHRSAS
jgi:MYXO-CTERM domain-containing protein